MDLDPLWLHRQDLLHLGMELLVLDQQNRQKQLPIEFERATESTAPLLGIDIDMEQYYPPEHPDAATEAMDVSGAGAEPTK